MRRAVSLDGPIAPEPIPRADGIECGVVPPVDVRAVARDINAALERELIAGLRIRGMS